MCVFRNYPLRDKAHNKTVTHGNHFDTAFYNVFISLCVSVCIRERERKKENGGDKDMITGNEWNCYVENIHFNIKHTFCHGGLGNT